MHIIGVIDLLDGRAVHALGGDRTRYPPMQSVAGLPIAPGDALALTIAYNERLGIDEVYVADLDAILGHGPQDGLIASIAVTGSRMWVDAAVSSADGARHVLGLGAAHVIVGLETLVSYDALHEICDAVDGARVAFSLDLRDGRPIVASCRGSLDDPAHVIASRAADAGVAAIIVLDLARVGSGAGLDFELLSTIRAAAPNVRLVAGGGVRDIDDIARLASLGCDGALVGTALHDGRIDRADVMAIERR